MSDTTSVFKTIVESIEREVSEFNESHEPKLTVSRLGAEGIQVFPRVTATQKQNRPSPVVVQIDRNTKVIQFDGTTVGPGVPRRDFFTINKDGLVVLKEHMVGTPKPPSEPMTPEHFSKFVLAGLFAKTA